MRIDGDGLGTTRAPDRSDSLDNDRFIVAEAKRTMVRPKLRWIQQVKEDAFYTEERVLNQVCWGRIHIAKTSRLGTKVLLLELSLYDYFSQCSKKWKHSTLEQTKLYASFFF